MVLSTRVRHERCPGEGRRGQSLLRAAVSSILFTFNLARAILCGISNETQTKNRYHAISSPFDVRMLCSE